MAATKKVNIGLQFSLAQIQIYLQTQKISNQSAGPMPSPNKKIPQGFANANPKPSRLLMLGFSLVYRGHLFIGCLDNIFSGQGQ
jgi:hypothetical protein